MEISPISASFLESTVQNNLFDGGSFLIIQESKVVGVLTNLRQNVTRVCESISDGNSFQSGNGTFVVLGFSENLLSDGWSVFSSVALSKNVEWMISFEFELVEASCRGGEQFFESIVKIISNTGHVGAVDFRDCFGVVIWLIHIKGLIGITETSSDGLVNKNNVVVFGPTVIVFFDIIGLHVGSSESEGAQLEEITELTWGARSSIEPENDWVISDFRLCGVLSSIEHEGEYWVSLVNIEISGSDNAIVEVGIDV